MERVKFKTPILQKDLKIKQIPELKIVIDDLENADEVIDSIVDAVEALVIGENALSDGLQWFDDLIALTAAQPRIKELINDAPVFWKQLKAIDPESAVPAVIEARRRLLAAGRTFGKIAQGFLDALYVLAGNFSYAMKGKEQYQNWEKLLSGESVFPV